MVPAPYSAITVVPCENAMGLAWMTSHAAARARHASADRAKKCLNRFMGTPPTIVENGAPMRAAPAINQAIGGGLTGGSATVGTKSAASANSCETCDTVKTSKRLGATAVPSRQDARQPLMEFASSGQQGQPWSLLMPA